MVKTEAITHINSILKTQGWNIAFGHSFCIGYESFHLSQKVNTKNIHIVSHWPSLTYNAYICAFEQDASCHFSRLLVLSSTFTAPFWLSEQLDLCSFSHPTSQFVVNFTYSARWSWNGYGASYPYPAVSWWWCPAKQQALVNVGSFFLWLSSSVHLEHSVIQYPHLLSFHYCHPPLPMSHLLWVTSNSQFCIIAHSNPLNT